MTTPHNLIKYKKNQNKKTKQKITLVRVKRRYAKYNRRRRLVNKFKYFLKYSDKGLKRLMRIKSKKKRVNKLKKGKHKSPLRFKIRRKAKRIRTKVKLFTSRLRKSKKVTASSLFNVEKFLPESL